MLLAKHNLLLKLVMFPAVSAIFMISLTSLDSHAQEFDETCPCFTYEEVKSLFQQATHLPANGGTSECSAQDYSAECAAAIVVMDQNYETIAQASVNWYDYDPGNCQYTASDPAATRNVNWPYPAPEATARACFRIISSVISESDDSGKCDIFP